MEEQRRITKENRMTMNHVDYQDVINKLAGFIELRFGVYLDTISGFQQNLEKFQRSQQEVAKISKRPIEELDKLPLSRGKGPPSSDHEEFKRLEIHCTTQGAFKKNNSPGGANHNFAIENCLSDISNYWNKIKEDSEFKEVKDIDVFPVMQYMRELRNRAQHDLYPDRIATQKKGSIIMGKTIGSYTFPTFEVGMSIRLSESDLEAMVFEVRAQLEANLIPYINEFLKNKELETP